MTPTETDNASGAYLKRFRDGLARFLSPDTPPSPAASRLARTASLPPEQAASSLTPDYHTESAHEGFQPTIMLSGNDHSLSQTPASDPVTPEPPPLKPVSPPRLDPLPRSSRTTRHASFDPAPQPTAGATPATPAPLSGHPVRPATAAGNTPRPDNSPDYATAAAHEGFVPLVTDPAPATSAAQQAATRQAARTLQEHLGQEGIRPPLEVNPSLASADPAAERKQARERAQAMQEQLGQEGIQPPLEVKPSLYSPVSAKARETTMERVRAVREQLAHEGGALPDDLEERTIEFHQRVQSTMKKIDRFLRENARQERFAEGLPGPGEPHQSVFKTYLDTQSEFEGEEHLEWKRAIDDLSDSTIGQADRDIYHSGAAGFYDLGSFGLSAGEILALPDLMPAPFGYEPDKAFTREVLYTDPDTETAYVRDSWGYVVYSLRHPLSLKAHQHRAARSDDYNHASAENPGYLAIRRLGEWSECLAGILFITGTVGALGATAELPLNMAMNAFSDYNRYHDEVVEEWLEKPEEQLQANKAYRAMRERGVDSREARYVIGHTYGRKEGHLAAFKSIGRSLSTYGLGKATRTGMEGGLLKTGQDMGAGHAFDGITDVKIDNVKKWFGLDKKEDKNE